MTTFFTSDQHFGHVALLRQQVFSPRNFYNVSSMNLALIAAWNRVVSPGDTVYMLGDFAFMSKAHARRIFSTLHGEKHLIVGNHDNRGIINLPWKSVQGSATVKSWRGYRYRMSHYPPEMKAVGDGMLSGNLYLHGHTHSRGPSSFPLFDVGVDANNLTPVSEHALDRAAVKYLSRLTKLGNLIGAKHATS